MENPFVYGRYVTDADFTDRREELAYLVRELEANGRIFLISPRRYKLRSSSYVVRGLKLLQQKGLVDKENDHYLLTDIFFEKWLGMGR